MSKRGGEDMAFYPDSNLGKIVLDPRVKRSLRRDVLAVVQMPDTPRRARLERSCRERLIALGVVQPE